MMLGSKGTFAPSYDVRIASLLRNSRAPRPTHKETSFMNGPVKINVSRAPALIPGMVDAIIEFGVAAGVFGIIGEGFYRIEFQGIITGIRGFLGLACGWAQEQGKKQDDASEMVLHKSFEL